jgi:hypothetical protein
MTPIYNDPNHFSYGPCRRLHLILLYLYSDNLSRLEEEYCNTICQGGWTHTLDTSPEKESITARTILNQFNTLASYIGV